MKRAIAIAMIAVLTGLASLRAEELTSVAEQQSGISKALRSAGSLLLRETHKLPTVETANGPEVTCTVMVLRDLLAKGRTKDITTVGIGFSIKEEYSERSAFIDMEEASGLLASIQKLSIEGQKILDSPIVGDVLGSTRSAEIHYTTKEKVTLAAFSYDGTLSFALKVSSLADWAILTTAGSARPKRNLEIAKEIASEAISD